MSDPHRAVPVSTLTGPSGFRATDRFGEIAGAAAFQPKEPQNEASEDPIAAAFADGHAAGIAEAQAQAAEQIHTLTEAREALGLSFARLDQQMEEDLRLRLRDTVSALCEAAIAPLALDQDALIRRVELAVSMLARADDERVIRLHPDDIELVSKRLAREWAVQPDPALERGSLRVESTNGGVEDGPATWRRAIAEALRQC